MSGPCLQVEREIALHSRLRHRNIVAFHGHFADRDHVYMVLEYCSRQVPGGWGEGSIRVGCARLCPPRVHLHLAADPERSCVPSAVQSPALPMPTWGHLCPSFTHLGTPRLS